MEHYVTLFDGNFLPQGLALIDSLERHGGEHTLWVLCLDDRAREVLDALARPNLRTIPLAEAETPELLAVKAGRTRAEYCWTLTPLAPRLVFDREPKAGRVTYVDADLYFLASPQPIFDELASSGKSVLITEHAYDPAYDQTELSGRFCVQFITFARDAGEPVRRWWEERCIEWCFNRRQGGKFGDQKYLDDWPERFPAQVHVLRQAGAILAPWNARRFPHDKAVAWHFHSLRIEGDRIRWYLGYEIPAAVERQVYLPYVKALESKVARLGGRFVQGDPESSAVAWLRWAHSLVMNRLGFPANVRHRKVSAMRSD